MAQLKKPTGSFLQDGTQKTAASGWVGSKYVGSTAPKTDYAVPKTPDEPVNTGGNSNLPKVTLAPTGNESGGPAPGLPSNPGPVLPGFDAAKWADPTMGTSNKYIGGKFLAGGGSIADMLKLPGFEGWSQVGDDKVLGAGGSTYDVYKDFGGPGQTVQWTAVSGPAWDKNGIPGVSSSGVNTGALESLKHDGIKGNYAAAVKAAQQGGGQTDPWAGYGMSQAPAGINGNQDPFSNALMKSWMEKIQGGQEDNVNKKIESITEKINMGKKSQIANMQALMADKGLLSAPGAPSGAEIGAYQNLEEEIAPYYAQAIRDALGDADEQELAVLQGGSAYQQMLAKTALDSLSQNMAWNQFLAEFGLKREQVMWEMENGNLGLIIPLLQMFAQQAQATQKGYV